MTAGERITMYKQNSNPAAIETQEKLRHSLLHELQTTPLNKVKISDLCKESGVSRNAFYRNFDLPEDILVYHLDTLCIDMVKVLCSISKGENYLEHYMAAFYRYWYDNRDTLDLFFHNNVSPLLIQRLSEMIEFTMVDSAKTVESDNPIKGYVFLSGGMISVLYTWIRRGYDIVPEDLARSTIDNLKRGLQYS